MAFFHAMCFVLLSYGFAAPASRLDLDKRRESTPEILGLEQELKKAAGENKQYFSSANNRPMPQIDGLDTNNEELQKSVDNDLPSVPGIPEDTAGDNDVIDNGNEGLTNGFPQNMESYMEMWKLFKQHPDFMEEMYQDYLSNPNGRMLDMNQLQPEEDPDEEPEYGQTKRGDVGVYAYPSENELLMRGAPYQGKYYVPSDADDRSDAVMADYAAASGSRLKDIRPEFPDIQDSYMSEGDSRAGNQDMYGMQGTQESSQENGEGNEHGGSQSNEEGQSNESDSEEDEEELHSLENSQPNENSSESRESVEANKSTNSQVDPSKLASGNNIPPSSE